MNKFLTSTLRLLIVSFLFGISFTTSAQDGKSKNEMAEKPSLFSAKADFRTKYISRGLEYGDAPVVFGFLNFDYEGLNIFADGSYAMNGSHREVDFGINYTWKWFTLGVSDYYFPTNDKKDHFFNYQPDKTGHYIEGWFNFNVPGIPHWFQASTYVMGPDRTLEGKQAFSTYLELGYRHSFSEHNHLSLALGISPNRSMYNHYEKKFCFANAVLTYETGISFKNFFLPVNASVVLNPYTQKPAFVLGIILSTKQ